MGPTCSIVYENEPARKGLLKEKPRPATGRLFGLRELSLSILQGGVIAAVLILIYQVAVNGGQSEDTTRAMIFIGMISANVALTLTNRSYQGSLAGSLKPGNKLILYTLVTTICLTVLIFLVPAVSELFRLSMPDTGRVLFSIGCGMASVLWFEIYKLLMGTLRNTTSLIGS